MTAIIIENKVILALINSQGKVEYTEYKEFNSGTIEVDSVCNSYKELVATALVTSGVVSSEELLFADIHNIKE